MSIKSYTDLTVWQRALALSVDVYKITEALPKSEQFGLCSQMRRAAVSVPANIAEGHGRQSDRELCRYLNIAGGSLSELETYLYLCEQLNLLGKDCLQSLHEQCSEAGKLLNGLIARVRKDIG